MIISELKKKTKEEIKYPILMIAEGGNVVLFESLGCGTLVKSDASNFWIVGHYSSHWASGVWVPFRGEVTLSNEDS
mgnify:CR=1 FL=1